MATRAKAEGARGDLLKFRRLLLALPRRGLGALFGAKDDAAPLASFRFDVGIARRFRVVYTTDAATLVTPLLQSLVQRASSLADGSLYPSEFVLRLSRCRIARTRRYRNPIVA